MNKYLTKVFLEHFGFGLTLPFIVVWQLSRGLNLTQIGVVAATIALTTFLFEIPTGLFADKMGRKTSLLTALILHAFSLGILAYAHTFFLFCIYGILSGLAWSLTSGTEEAYVFEISEQNKANFRHALSNMSIADETGTLLGMVLATVVARIWGIQEVLITATFIMVCATVFISFFIQDSKYKNTELEKKKLFQRTQTFITKHSPYFMIMVLLAVYYEGGRILWQPQLVKIGVPIYQLGILFAVFKIFAICGAYLAKKYSPKELKNSFLIFGCLLAVLFLGMGAPIKYVSLLAFCLYAGTENYFRILQSHYVNSIISVDRATFLSVNNLIRNGYSTAITPFLGLLADQRLFLGFITLAILQLCASILLHAKLSRSYLLGS